MPPHMAMRAENVSIRALLQGNSEWFSFHAVNTLMSREALQYAPCTEGCGAFSWRLSTELTAALPVRVTGIAAVTQPR